MSSPEEFARRFAAETVEGMKIAGFGAGDPPAPGLPPGMTQAAEEAESKAQALRAEARRRELQKAMQKSAQRMEEKDPDDDDEVPYSNWPVPGQPQAPPEPAAERPLAELVVLDTRARYKGKDVVLSDEDRAQVARIVLEAVSRGLKAELDEVRKAAPRRRRKAPEGEPKKKRGRPRKEPQA